MSRSNPAEILSPYTAIGPDMEMSRRYPEIYFSYHTVRNILKMPATLLFGHNIPIYVQELLGIARTTSRDQARSYGYVSGVGDRMRSIRAREVGVAVNLHICYWRSVFCDFNFCTTQLNNRILSLCEDGDVYVRSHDWEVL